MSKIKDAARFSEVCGVNPAHLAALGAFDPLLNVDTPLFIDPLLLENSAIPEMRVANDLWIAHFEEVVLLLTRVKAIGDQVWRAAERKFRFPEVPGTCLGYGSGIRGSGIGTGLRSRLLETARRIIDLGVEDPRLFILLPLIEADIGPDRISDMTTSIIGPQLAAYTQRVLTDQAITIEGFTIGPNAVQLPRNPLAEMRTPVIIVPRDILRDLPIASDWEDIAAAAAANDDLRERINRRIGDIWTAKMRREKQELRTRVLANRLAIDTLLNVIADSDKEPYDVAIDPAGVNRWFEDGYSFALENPIQIDMPERRGPAQLVFIVEAIINQFREVIENNGLWKLLHVNGSPRREKYAQLLFFGVAQAYCEANNIDISPESDAGGGPVDFKFSTGSDAKVVVELKLSKNARLRHGYTNQLEAYKNAERTDLGYFLIMDVGGGERQIEAVQVLETNARRDGDRHSKIEIVDATPKASASRR